MSIPITRPPVAELVFQLYGRPLHPELFDILAVRKIQREDYRLTVWITRTGHVVTWENANVFLTEVTASQDQELPQGRRLLHYRMRNEQSKALPCAHGITYQMSFQVEVMQPEIFFQVHDEILADGSKRGFLHNFRDNDRLHFGPLGFLSAEARPGLLLVTSFHTFPDEYTVVKTQSLIERTRRD
jgi:hypothetical protein